MTFLVISCHRTFHNSTFIYELIQNVFVWKKKISCPFYQIVHVEDFSLRAQVLQTSVF